VKPKLRTGGQALPRAIETRYVRDLQRIMRRVVATYAEAVGRALRTDSQASAAGFAVDDVTDDVALLVASDVARVSVAVAHKIVKANEGPQLYLPGLGPVEKKLRKIDPGFAPEIAAFRDRNIKLVENAARVYAQDVRDIVSDPANAGLRVEVLRGKLLERGNVSESRAALIARDQTLKFNGQVTQMRQERAGVKRYEWSTSRDERVRDTHRVKEGQIFEWSSPPPDTGHPSQDYQCRCVAIPVFEDED
jgi:SPP1 gp7 family putative phage head morphogenesis protein